MFRPSCLLRAYVGILKYLLVCAVLLANYLFNVNLIFCSDRFMAAAAGLGDVIRCKLIPFRGDGQTLGCQISWGVAWTFVCKTFQIEKSSGSSPSVIHPLIDIFSVRMHPLDPGHHILSRKLLLDVGIDPYASRDWLSANKICKICYSFC